MSDIEGTKRQSVVDRYFVRKYKTDQKRKEGEDICILEHSNKICIVTLAHSHPAVQQSKEITKVDFKIDEKTNRLENKVSGKLKRGAQWINEGSPLCHITCEDGSLYTVNGCIRGSLVEVNENLIANPQLVVTKPDTEGYIAILLPKLNEQNKEMSKLLTEEQYKTVLLKRSESVKDADILT